jgi:type I restriction enzyme, S subunit
MATEHSTSGWTKTTLKDSCFRPEYGYTASASLKAVGPRFLRITDIQDGRVEWDKVPHVERPEDGGRSYLLEAGDIVIARIGATTGKAFLIRECPEAVFASYLIRLRTKPGLLAEFLSYWFQTPEYWQHINSQKGGRLKGGVNIPILENLEMPLPSPIEQCAIARALDAVQRSKEARQRELVLERERKAALMEYLFTHGTRGEPTKQTEIGEIPESWQTPKIDSILRLKQYGLSVRGNRVGSVPILRMNNLADGRVDLTDLQWVDIDERTLRAFVLRHGDVLFNRTNSQDLVGKTGLFDHEGTYVCASYLVRLTFNDTVATSRFMNAYLNLTSTQHRLKGMASRGVSQSNISAGKLGNFLVPLPSLNEQEEIAAVSDALHWKINSLIREEAKLDELFRAMLDELMTGRLSAVPLIEEHQAQ